MFPRGWVTCSREEGGTGPGTEAQAGQVPQEMEENTGAHRGQGHRRGSGEGGVSHMEGDGSLRWAPGQRQRAAPTLNIHSLLPQFQRQGQSRGQTGPCWSCPTLLAAADTTP